MAVKALKNYQFTSADSVDKFHGNQLIYVGWDNHLMFCAPLAYCVPPSTLFKDFCEKMLSHSYQYHPDWKSVDFSKVVWLKSGKAWSPSMDKTFSELGLQHKDVLRFQTPGLDGINGTCS
jgi:phenol hydroxylase P4 protein